MKIFSAAQIRECDAQTIKNSSITSLKLMERAASRCVAWIKDHLPADSLFVVLCGSGNNGGDGLAITRMLHQLGYGAKAFLLAINEELSTDCEANLVRLQKISTDLAERVARDTFITDLPPNIIIVDAILGTGLNRPASGWLETFIRQINKLPNRKIAVDIPSGLSADVAPSAEDAIINVRDTLSFQFYKRTFLHPESGHVAGKIHLIDIGLDAGYIKNTATHFQTLDARDAIAMRRPRSAFSHKGSFGHVYLTGGHYGKMGAITLASRAALRAGAGLVTACIPGCGMNIIQTAAPEVMCTASGEEYIERIEDWEAADSVGIGPGMGQDTHTAIALTSFLKSYKKPVVLDADALNIIARNPDLLACIPPGSIITPHPKEFARLFGENTNSLVQVDNARIQAMRYNITIVLKGHHTAIIDGDGDCHYNMNGNAGMATAGSGDVLTGIITSLLAQGYEPYNAAQFGVFLHGLAGDIAAAGQTQESMIASDIIDNIGNAFKSLSK